MGVRWYWFLPRDERGWRERSGRGEWARRSPKGWKETSDEIRRGPGELDRERKPARVEVNEGVRELSKWCEGDDTIEKEQHERGAG